MRREGQFTIGRVLVAVAVIAVLLAFSSVGKVLLPLLAILAVSWAGAWFAVGRTDRGGGDLDENHRATFAWVGAITTAGCWAATCSGLTVLQRFRGDPLVPLAMIATIGACGFVAASIALVAGNRSSRTFVVSIVAAISALSSTPFYLGAAFLWVYLANRAAS